MRKAIYGSAKGKISNPIVTRETANLISQFEALVPLKPRFRKAGKGEQDGYLTLALKTTRLLKATYPDSKPELEKTYTSCLSQITRLKKSLEAAAKTDLKDPALKFSVLSIIKGYGDALSFQFAQYKINQTAVYREKVETRSQTENRVELDLSEYVKNAYAVLSLPENFSWLDVSCAIALVTGRRMGEVHMSAEFTAIEGETHKLKFTGQLKGKGRKIKGTPLHQHEFTIPTLVPAQLVINGIAFLEAAGKRIDYRSTYTYGEVSDRSPMVNARFSKDLNLKAKNESWAILPDGVMTYHKFRGAYLRAALVNSGVDAFDYLDYARSVLGDKDEATIKAYQRFTIKKGSITQL